MDLLSEKDYKAITSHQAACEEFSLEREYAPEQRRVLVKVRRGGDVWGRAMLITATEETPAAVRRKTMLNTAELREFFR